MALLITPEHLAAIAGGKTPLMALLAESLNRICPGYGIDTPQEYAHFLAQACHETDHFRTLREYASGRAYEGRADLGNTQPGDGPRFRGRGIFQTTGRANYLQLGIKQGRRDLFVNRPELLEQPDYAVWSACEYWATRGLNDIANHADTDRLMKKLRNGTVLSLSPVEFISRTINGGTNGMDERKRFYAIACRVLAPVTRGARLSRAAKPGQATRPGQRAKTAQPATGAATALVKKSPKVKQAAQAPAKAAPPAVRRTRSAAPGARAR